jgi:flagellar FliL protein
MDEAAASQGKGASKGGRGRRLPVVVAALVLLVAGCAAWYLFRHLASSAHQKAKAEPAVKVVLHLEPFLVNLADPESDRFLRVGIDLGLDRELGEHDRAGQSALPIARARDTILMILTTCNADALTAPAGKVKLKDELTRALQEQVPVLRVREIYFTEFLVQR